MTFLPRTDSKAPCALGHSLRAESGVLPVLTGVTLAVVPTAAIAQTEPPPPQSPPPPASDITVQLAPAPEASPMPTVPPEVSAPQFSQALHIEQPEQPEQPEPNPPAAIARIAAPTPASPAFTSPADSGDYSTQAEDLGAIAPASLAQRSADPSPSPATNSVPAPSPNRLAQTGTGAPAPQFSPAPDLPAPLPTAPPTPDPAYRVAPYEPAAGEVAPLVTRFDLNGVRLQDGRGQLTTRLDTGDGRSTNLNFAATAGVGHRVEQAITADGVLQIDQSSQAVQALSVLDERRLTLTRSDPQTLIGQEIRMSLTADCAPLRPVAGQCTYTPGLTTDRSSYDPNFLFPTRIDQPSNLGDVVTPESLAAIRQPGFQRGANGQVIGLDLYFPNSGSYPGNQITTASTVARDEQFLTLPALSFATFNQSVRANGDRAVLARTLQAPTLLLDQDMPVENVLLAIAALLLPQPTATLAPTAAPANPDLNQSLFLAASNSRLPDNSLTFYQTGWGSAATPQTALDDLADLPRASFNSVWLGLSPITDRSYAQTTPAYDLLSDPRTVAAAGAEGGVTDSVSLVSIANGLPFASSTLQNSYTQIYLRFTEQDANLVNTFEQIDQIRYRPHASFTGNVTGPYDVLRYYAGVIAADRLQAYAGLDYSADTPSGFSYGAGAIAYLNPSYDNYTRLSGRVSQRFDLGPNTAFTLAGSLNWALDQNTRRGDIEERSRGSDIVVRSQLTTGPVALGLTQTFGGVLPNSKETRTVASVAWRVSPRLSLAGYWALADASRTSPQAGLSLDWRWGEGPAAPVLSLGWNNTLYRYGQDLFDREIRDRSNTFSLSFRMGL